MLLLQHVLELLVEEMKCCKLHVILGNRRSNLLRITSNLKIRKFETGCVVACLMAFELAQFLGRISNLACQGPAPHRQGKTSSNLENMVVLMRAGRSVDFLQLRLSLTLRFDLPTRTVQMWDNQLEIDAHTIAFFEWGCPKTQKHLLE